MATTAGNAVETKLYVTNFPSSATRQQLQQFFSRFGRVQECAIMWNSYAFVHYATMEEARRALDQSNGAMFLNRKLIVQLSTSRFRPQPKESNNSSPKQLMIMPYQQQQQQQQLNTVPSQYFDMMPPIDPSPPNFFRPPSPLTQEMNNYYSNMKLNKALKTDMGLNGELPKLYCTNLPDNCKANDLQRLFSTFGQVIDCVILWDYYAFVTYKSFHEAERALIALNGYTWKDRTLIVEWSRASGRKQQQTSPRHCSDQSNSTSPRIRPTSLVNLSHNNNNNINPNQLYTPNSPMKSQTFNLMPMMSQQTYSNRFDLDLSPFIDTNTNSLFSSSSELNTPSSATSISNVYQPSDIIALLEPLNSNKSMNDITNVLSSSSAAAATATTNTNNQVPPSCSSAAAQENLLSSLFHSFEPFNKFYSNDEQSSTAFNNHFSSLLTTAPDKNHFPISYAHNNSWH